MNEKECLFSMLQFMESVSSGKSGLQGQYECVQSFNLPQVQLPSIGNTFITSKDGDAILMVSHECHFKCRNAANQHTKCLMCACDRHTSTASKRTALLTM